MDISNIRLEQIKIQYKDFLRDMRSFPSESLQKRKVKKEMHEYLKSVRDRFGQEVVDKVCDVYGQTKPKEKLLTICPICKASILEKNLKKHASKRHTLL